MSLKSIGKIYAKATADYNCHSCGAPRTFEYCQYCGSGTKPKKEIPVSPDEKESVYQSIITAFFFAPLLKYFIEISQGDAENLTE